MKYRQYEVIGLRTTGRFADLEWDQLCPHEQEHHLKRFELDRWDGPNCGDDCKEIHEKRVYPEVVKK